MAGVYSNSEGRWTVDLMAASATHECGFSVRFITLPTAGSPTGESVDEAPLCRCCAADGREWWLVMMPALLQKTIEDLVSRHGQHAAQELLARLSREACDVWVEQKVREH